MHAAEFGKEVVDALVCCVRWYVCSRFQAPTSLKLYRGQAVHHVGTFREQQQHSNHADAWAQMHGGDMYTTTAHLESTTHFPSPNNPNSLTTNHHQKAHHHTRTVVCVAAVYTILSIHHQITAFCHTNTTLGGPPTTYESHIFCNSWRSANAHSISSVSQQQCSICSTESNFFPSSSCTSQQPLCNHHHHCSILLFSGSSSSSSSTHDHQPPHHILQRTHPALPAL